MFFTLLGALGLAAGAFLTFIPAGDRFRFSDLRFGMLTASLALLLGLAVAAGLG